VFVVFQGKSGDVVALNSDILATARGILSATQSFGFNVDDKADKILSETARITLDEAKVHLDFVKLEKDPNTKEFRLD
jgi:hypothetical protein